MWTANRSRPAILKFFAALAVTAACSLPMWAGTTTASAAGNAQISGIPEDWSSHRVIFSNPGTADEANRAGRYAQWSATVSDPRYKIQQIRRSMPIQQQARAFRPGLTGNGRTEDAGMISAPFLPQALSAWRSSNRTVRGALQLAVVLTIALVAVLFWRRRWASALTLMVVTAMFLTLTSCTGVGTSSLSGTASGLNLDWSMLPTKAAVGTAGVFPAKYSSSGATGASCSDYVVYPTGVAGSATAASIDIYTNLYSGCSGAAPEEIAAVNLNAGTVVTSPVLSLDGTQVAFVATIGTTASLVVMDLPSAPTNVTVTQITAKSTTTNASTHCTAPCANWIAFTPGNADTTSSPFYDYSGNAIYVGDAKGVLHKFQNVFHSYYGATNTTEVNEVSSGGFPATVLANDPLSSPVLDSGTSGLVFVGIDAATEGIASVSQSGTVVLSPTLNKANATHSFDIIVDSSAELVYVFTSHGQGPTHDTANVILLPAAFTHTSTPSYAYLGTGGATSLDTLVMYAGQFDNGYYTSGTPTSPSGNLYVCADSINASTATVAPTLFRVAITSGAFGTVSTGPVLSGTATANCSPTTEFDNGTDDLIFVSQTGTNITAAPISCPTGTGCLMSFNVNSGSQTFSTTAPTTANTVVQASGTSGIIIDNNASSPAGAANIYFATLASQSCARTVTGNDTRFSANITATSGIFTSGDVGATITGTGISGGTTISSVQSSTAATMNQNDFTSSNTGVAFSLTDSGGCAIQTLQTSF